MFALNRAFGNSLRHGPYPCTCRRSVSFLRTPSKKSDGDEQGKCKTERCGDGATKATKKDWFKHCGWLSKRYARYLEEKEMMRDPESRLLVGRGMSLLTYGITATALVGTAGVDITPILAGLGSAGVTVGLALRDALEKAAGGVQLLLTCPFHAGDVIRFKTAGSDWHGEVVSMDYCYVRMHLKDGGFVAIPSHAVNGAVVVVEKRRAPTAFGGTSTEATASPRDE